MLWVELKTLSHAYFGPIQIWYVCELEPGGECMRMELAGLPGKERAQSLRHPSG